MELNRAHGGGELFRFLELPERALQELITHTNAMLQDEADDDGD